MKITSISLTAFRSHLKTAITGLSSVNIFVGQNGSGKTTILDAIGYALTGVCRGVDEGGRGAEALASQLPDVGKVSTAVALKTDKGDITRGLGQGPRSQAHVKIVGKLGIEDKVLRVLAAPMNLLRLERRKQEEVFFSLTGSSVTVEQVREALGDIPVERLGIDYDSLTTPDGRTEALRICKDRRVNRKRDIQALVFTPSAKELPEYDPEAYEDLTSRANTLQGEIAGGRGAAGQAEKSVNHLQDLIDAASVRLEGLTEGDCVKEVLRKEQVDAMRARIEHRRKLSEGLAVERNKASSLVAEVRGLADEIKRIAKFGAECPECGQAIDPSYTKHRIDDMKKAHDKVAKEASDIDAKCKVIERDINIIDVNDLLAKISRSERAAQSIDNIKAERVSLTNQIKDLKDRLDSIKVPAQKDWSEKEAELVLLRGKADDMQAAKSEREREKSVNESRTAIEEELAWVEKLVKAIGPGGVIQQMMAADGTAEMVEAVKGYGAALGVGEISIAFGPWQIFLNGRPIELASASEEFRVAAAFGIAFGVKAGASILCLDGAEILFGEFRSQFQDLVFSCGLEQVFVACTTESMAESAPAVEGLAMYSVVKDESGRSVVKPIKQEVAA